MSFIFRLTLLMKSFLLQHCWPRISLRSICYVVLILLCFWYTREIRLARLELQKKLEMLEVDDRHEHIRSINHLPPPEEIQAQPSNSIQQKQKKSKDIKKIITETELFTLLNKDCEANINTFHVKLTETDDNVLTMTEYKKQLAKSFTKQFINSVNKTKIATSLTIYKESQNNTDPSKGLYDRFENINIKEIDLELQKDKEKRLKAGDDDLLKIKEVIEAMNDHKYKVPNIIHFVWFGHKRFMVHQYMAIIAAFRYQKPKVILFHYDEEPKSEYWLALKNIVGSTLKLVKRSRPKSIFGQNILKIVHQSDVVRMQALMEVGGIYLDLDSIVLKSVDRFRKYDMVLPRPHRYYALANAIIFANKDSWFMRRWYNEYKHFKSNDWSYNSLDVPGSIAYYYPDTIHVTEKELCRPNWSETDMLFKGVFDWKPIYITHLFARVLLKKDGMEERPLKQLAVLNTTYGEIARHVIWGNKRIRDVTDWIVTCDIEKQLWL